MALTLTELQDKLKNIDEISLMEVLEITSEDLVNRFVDKIRDRMDELVTEFDDGLSEDYDPGNEWRESSDNHEEVDYD